MGVARAAPPADVAPADGARRAGAAVRVPAAVPAARGTASVGLQGAEPSEAAEVLVELGVSEAPAVPEATAGPEVRAGSVQAAVPAGPAIGAPAGPAYRGRRSAGMATPPGLEGGPYHPEPGAPPGARHKRSSRRRRGTVTGGLPGVAGTGLGRGATAPLGPGATAPLVPGATAREIARGRTRRTDPTPGPFRARSAGRRRRAETCGRASPGRRGPIGRAARGQASNA